MNTFGEGYNSLGALFVKAATKIFVVISICMRRAKSVHNNKLIARAVKQPAEG